MEEPYKYKIGDRVVVCVGTKRKVDNKPVEFKIIGATGTIQGGEAWGRNYPESLPRSDRTMYVVEFDDACLDDMDEHPEKYSPQNLGTGIRNHHGWVNVAAGFLVQLGAAERIDRRSRTVLNQEIIEMRKQLEFMKDVVEGGE